MAVCDVETEAQYLEVIEYQTNPLREAQKRRGQRPHDRISRDVTYSRFMENLKLLENTNTADVVNWSFVESAYPPCTSPLNELSQVAIRNLQLETHHRGTYLLLRSITPQAASWQPFGQSWRITIVMS